MSPCTDWEYEKSSRKWNRGRNGLHQLGQPVAPSILFPGRCFISPVCSSRNVTEVTEVAVQKKLLPTLSHGDHDPRCVIFWRRRESEAICLHLKLLKCATHASTKEHPSSPGLNRSVVVDGGGEYGPSNVDRDDAVGHWGNML